MPGNVSVPRLFLCASDSTPSKRRGRFGFRYKHNRSLMGTRQVTFTKLKLPYEKDDFVLTEADISTLTHQGIIRSAQYLWMAECCMSDLSKLDTVPDLDDHLLNLSRICCFMDQLLSGMIR